MVKLKMTYDDARKMARYLQIGKSWPDWEFPDLELELYDPDPDVDSGELEVIMT